MKRIYTFGHEQVDRNITVGDMLDNKKNDIKMTQVTAGNQEEAEIVAGQNIDMIITGSDWYQDVRKGAPNTFITAALFAGRFVTNEEILRGAFDVMMNGADSVLTPRSMDVVEMLAKEGMQVQGHVGMVPSMATKYGGIRTVGKTADEAISILKDMKRLEDAGAFGAEVECVAEDALIELKKHKYAICPRGNGIDTHRIWECLYLDVIPIMLKRDYFGIDNLPIIYLNSWDELDVNNINTNFKNII